MGGCWKKEASMLQYPSEVCCIFRGAIKTRQSPLEGNRSPRDSRELQICNFACESSLNFGMNHSLPYLKFYCKDTKVRGLPRLLQDLFGCYSNQQDMFILPVCQFCGLLIEKYYSGVWVNRGRNIFHPLPSHFLSIAVENEHQLHFLLFFCVLGSPKKTFIHTQRYQSCLV